MNTHFQKYRHWIGYGVLCCVIIGLAVYIAAQAIQQAKQEQPESAYTRLVNCAIYYNELEAYGEPRPELNQENFHNLVWDFLEPYRKQHISTNERYVWGDYNQQRAYLLFFLKHYYEECLREE